MYRRMAYHGFTGLLLLLCFILPTYGGENMALSITSPVFENGGEIPSKYTCRGEDISPELVFSGIPDGTKSLVLVMDDPDAPDPVAPKMTWVHWILYNLPFGTSGLKENIHTLPAGSMGGINSWNRIGYGGPCPPIGRHRYFFKLYALDTVLIDLHEPTESVLDKAMREHVLAQAELIGMYHTRYQKK